jgi:hypothetical protein
MLSISVGDSTGEVPGLQSVATAIGTPCLRSRSTGGFFVSERVEGAGQQHRDHARLGHRRDARLVGMFEMIGGQRAELGRQRRAASGC